MHLDGWDVVLWVHLLAMAMFVGGQLFLGLAVVPVFRAQGGSDGPARDWLVPIARRFGWASVGALALLLLTGSSLASHLDLWSDTAMQIKLGLVGLALGLTALHVFTAHGAGHALQGLILLDSLAIVLVATAL
jgi:uncharacterized membrane protein